MKSLLLSLTVLCALSSYSQSPMYIDRNGDPVNRKCIPHLEKDQDIQALAANCCCDFSYMAANPLGSPPTTAASMGRFQLTADSLFINDLTSDNVDLDSVFMALDESKGSKIILWHVSLTVVFSEVEIHYGSAVDHGNYWAFGIGYIDYPASAFPTNRPTCMGWEFGTNATAPNGFIPLAGTDTLAPVFGPIEILTGTMGKIYQNDSGFQKNILFVGGGPELIMQTTDSTAGTLARYQTGSDNLYMVAVDASGYTADFTLGPNNTTYNTDYPGNNGIVYGTLPAAVAPNTLIWEQYLLDYVEVWQGNGPPALTGDHLGRHYHDQITVPIGVYEYTSGGWVLLN